jgi:uncharacterized protein (TIGR02246 family)
MPEPPGTSAQLEQTEDVLAVSRVFAIEPFESRGDEPGTAVDPRSEIACISSLYLATLLDADARAHAALFLEEALAIPPQGAVLRGRAAIEEALLVTFATYRFVSAEMARIDVRLLGETAIETGHYRYDVTSPDTGAEQTLSGRYAMVWKRHENVWRIAFDTTQPGIFA